jgi:hypothetical protein
MTSAAVTLQMRARLAEGAPVDPEAAPLLGNAQSVSQLGCVQPRAIRALISKVTRLTGRPKAGRATV